MMSVIVVSCAQNQTIKSPDLNERPSVQLNVKKWQLDNGLRLLVLENRTLPIMSYYTFYEVGGRHESKGTTGATHFLEHMMFRGSKNYPPQVFDSTIERAGGSTNAYTNFDMTVYYESMPADHLEKIIEMEADRVKNLLLVPELVEKEREVIFEERKMRYENRPDGKIYQSLLQEVFKGTPYGGSVIGEIEDLKILTPENLRSFHDRFYVPNNMVLVIAGDVDADEVYSLVRKNFGDIKAVTDLDEFKKVADALERYQFKRPIQDQTIKLNGQSPTPIFMYGFQGLPIGPRESFTLDILSSVLGDGESSWLSQNLVRSRRPLLTSVYAANYTLQHNGIFFFGGEVAKGKNIDQVKKTFRSFLKGKMCDEAITERTVQKTKNQYLQSYFNSLKTNAGVAHFVGLRESYFGDYNFYKKEIEIYESITTDEVKAVCSKMLAEKEGIFISIWDKNPRQKGN